MRTMIMAALLAGVASPAIAQTATASEAEGGEIIVTAQKRAERLVDVPLSIVVRTGEELKNGGINDFNQIMSRVPNLVVVDTPANKSITIRGIGTSGNSFSFEQSVALFVDGVYGGRNRQYNQPFLDVEQIEVLRGPQGALFGRNTSAGAIAIRSTRPTQTLGGEVSAEYETVRGSTNVTGIINAPVSDKLAVRLAGRYALNNGWLDNTTLDRKEPVADQYLLRGSLLFTPSDTVTLFAKLEYTKQDITGSAFEFVPAGTRPDYLKDTDDAFSPERDNSDNWNGAVQLDVELGTHTLTAITGYSYYGYEQAFNIQARRPARLVVDNSERFSQWSQEVRLVSPSDTAFDYIVGAYAEWGRSRVRRQSTIDTPAPPGINTITFRTFDQDTDVLAAFAQAGYKLTDTLKLSGGLRWTNIRKRGLVTGFTRLFNVPPAPASLTIPRADLEGRFTENAWAPSATLSWSPNRDLNLFLRYARGDKGGAFSEFQNVTADTFILAPEKSDVFEAGLKAQFPEVNGFFSLVAFTTDYSDLQKSALDINTASFITSNAAGARTRGVELEASVSPVEGLRLSAAAAYLDAFYTSWPNGPCRFDNPARLVPGCTQSRQGDRLQSSPTWTGNLAIDYDRPVSDSLRVFGSGFLNFQSDINYQESGSPLEVQTGFARTDVRLGVGSADRKWELALLVRNLFDVRTSSLIFEVFPVGVGPNDRAHVPDPRRSFTLQGRVAF
ncbi:iron complex outermembrane receptor protein [Polymorphobacter multimanifer]|uniref:Iron complex outermembrane receptor protein n=1 Tax=Polymorphobacter multimanifer TaxID=1070431 RepID=A0A841L660_9SPHN|nr:TonB-dependent receptor [Polymorphobacter multimanifer]MBB6227910.1 iron complex outermembrane receptor protein [Polymorphobacter multimanifer]